MRNPYYKANHPSNPDAIEFNIGIATAAQRLRVENNDTDLGAFPPAAAAEIRDRWAVMNVLIRDEGERLVVEPLPDSTIQAVRGILRGRAKGEITSAEARRLWRAEDNAAMERKWREYYGALAAGLGVDIDPDALERYTTKVKKWKA